MPAHPPAWQSTPPAPGTNSTPRPSRSAAPPEVWLVAIGLLVVAGVLLDPVVRVGGPLLSYVFSSNALTRAFASLVLEVVAVVAAIGVTLVLLAVGLLRGSRVAQLLTCLLAGLMSFAELVSISSTPAYGIATSTTTVAVVCLVTGAVVLLLTLSPGSRTFFASDARPLGVDTAAVTNVLLGSICLLDGVLLMLAGAAGAMYVWIGLGFGVVGAALVTTNRPLRAGRSWARVLSIVVYAALAIIAVVLGVQTDAASAPSTLVPIGIALAATVALTVPASSSEHFARPVAPARPATPGLAAAAATIAAVMVAVAAAVGFTAAGKSNQPDYGLTGNTPTYTPSYPQTSVPAYPSSSTEPAYAAPMTQDVALQTAQDTLSAMGGTASVNECNGTLPSLSISTYTIGEVNEQSSGTFYVTADVTLDDGSTEAVNFLVTDDTLGNPCAEADTVQTTPNTPPTSFTPTTPSVVAAPADVPSIPSSGDPVPIGAAPPNPPQNSTVVAYGDSATVPTRPSEIVEWRPARLTTDQRTAVRDVIAFMTYINQQNFDSAWARSTERLSGSSPNSAFIDGYRTSAFYQVAFGQPRRVASDLMVIPGRFVSRQDPTAQGNPPGLTACTYWPQYLFVVARANGRWLVDHAVKYTNRSELDPMKRPGADGNLYLNPVAQRVSC